ncbi:hypothetical protein APB26_32175 [Pseudomonas aeruginosa]|nr:hypothetical protein APB26_32175 [Pseudomonas aeruginosa]RPV61313.1 hypothetical protein IPC838_18510 [Pseudomonas aeruginosa]
MQASSRIYFVGYLDPERTALAIFQLDLSAMHKRTNCRPASSADFLDPDGAIEHARDLARKFRVRLALPHS